MSAPTRLSARLSGLDGLRALAVIAVLSYHVAEWSKFTFAGPLASVLWELKGGVAVFFAISGAVLYLPYARAIRDRERLPDWRAYGRRRAVRILPAYWIALTVIAIGPFSAGVLGPRIGSYYGLSQIYSSDTLFSGLPGAWSLCVEVTFYAALPFFAIAAASLARRLRPGGAVRAQVASIALLGVITILMRGALAGSLSGPLQDRGLALAVALPGFLDWFAIGMALAVLAAEWEAGRASGRALLALGQRPGWCLALALAAFGVGIPAQHADMFLPWYGLLTHLALGVGSGCLVLAAIAPPCASRPAFWIRVLRGPSLTWVGTISYGIYLWNCVVRDMIHRQPASHSLFTTVLIWFAVLAGTLAVAAASWYLIERPSQRWLRAREARRGRPVRGGRMTEIDASVHSTVDPLNSAGVAVDHLA